MLGIVHNSPVVMSIFLDRQEFRKELVTEEEASDGSWRDKVDGLAAGRDGRSRVLFIEKLKGLQDMLGSGFEAETYKIVLFDSQESIGGLEGLDIIDAKMGGDTGRIYRLLPEKFNKALAKTAPGVVDGVEDYDPSAELPDLPASKARPVIDSAQVSGGAPMSEANAVMESIMAGAKEEAAKPEETVLVMKSPEASDGETFEVMEVPASEAVPKEDVEAAADEAEAAAEADEDPGAEEQPDETDETAAEPEDEEPEKPKKKKKKSKKTATSKKKKSLDSHKLF